eukprot:10253389-Heterocapsa_arctica.AAC.1
MRPCCVLSALPVAGCEEVVGGVVAWPDAAALGCIRGSSVKLWRTRGAKSGKSADHTRGQVECREDLSCAALLPLVRRLFPVCAAPAAAVLPGSRCWPGPSLDQRF